MENEFHPKKMAIFLIVIIFGSGFAIWGYNFVKGKNLAEPPQFDLSVYDKPAWPTPDEAFGEVFEENVDSNDLAEVENEFAKTVKDNLDNLSVKLEANRIYFSEYFQNKTCAETKNFIRNFLEDFNELKMCSVIDIAAQKCYSVEIPVEKREDITAQLKSMDMIEQINVSTDGAPKYEVCFVDYIYKSEAESVLNAYENIKILDPNIETDEYIAYISFDPNSEELKPILEKIENEYSDVVKVVK